MQCCTVHGVRYEKVYCFSSNYSQKVSTESQCLEFGLGQRCSPLSMDSLSLALLQLAYKGIKAKSLSQVITASSRGRRAVWQGARR